MGISNSDYDAIIREYEEHQMQNQALLKQRTDSVYQNVEGYHALADSIASISVAQGKKLLAGDESALKELKSTIEKLSSMKKDLLIGAGYPADYLDPIYTCPDCKDTGYIGLQKCHCLKQAIIKRLYVQSGLEEQLHTDQFDALTYDYVEGEDRLHFERTVQECKSFLKTFDSDYHNLFFYGTVGTGKSFLSSCIAHELIEGGYSVIYFSAAALFETLAKNKFDHKNNDLLLDIQSDVSSCDLLIIDDLGTEYTNNVIVSLFFSLLNERHLARKSTIISTNLSLEELRDRYSDRIFSRITNQYTICKFTGPDIRMLKKRLQSRK